MTDTVTIEDYQWLVAPAAKAWLEKAAQSPDPTAANLVAKLRNDLSPARTSLVLQQVNYRQRARHRFEFASQMFFTDKGLQQATDDRIAAYKAKQTVDAYGADTNGADLCCGIGGDLMQFTKENNVTGFDLDAASVCLARVNMSLVSKRHSTVECGDVLQVPLPEFGWWHCDPDRRADGQRTSQVILSTPSETDIDRFRKNNPNGSIKLAPAAQVAPEWQEQAELEWIGHHRQCQQLWARFGRLARHPGRATATTLDAEGQVLHSLTGDRAAEAPVADSIGDYLFEPATAIIAARLTSCLANQAGLKQVQRGIAYLTGGPTAPVAGLTRFKIEELLPFDMRRLKAALRERSIGDLEIKKRVSTSSRPNYSASCESAAIAERRCCSFLTQSKRWWRSRVATSRRPIAAVIAFLGGSIARRIRSS